MTIKQRLFPEPSPCTCGERRIQTWFVGWGYDGILPFWVQMHCPTCGRWGKRKLFRCRAVCAWNEEVMA